MEQVADKALFDLIEYGGLVIVLVAAALGQSALIWYLIKRNNALADKTLTAFNDSIKAMTDLRIVVNEFINKKN